MEQKDRRLSKKGSQKKQKATIGRFETKRVLTAKGRKLSSTNWIRRQINDPYVQEAQKQGLRSRAWFKLQEIDHRFQLIKPHMAIIDLGCAPGGWLQYSDGILKGTGNLIGIDLLEVEPIGAATIIEGDFNDDQMHDHLREELKGQKAHIVMSDMAAPTTGHKNTDQLRTGYLAEEAFEFALTVLRSEGCFISKVFEGGAPEEVLRRLKSSFKRTQHIKPNSSRKQSPEMYLLAQGFKGK